MSAKHFAGRLPSAWRRAFSTSLPFRKPLPKSGAGPEQAWGNPAYRHPAWSGRSVVVLTATAGLLGFGLAAASLQGPPKRAVTLFDSKMPTPQYASMVEMEDVS